MSTKARAVETMTPSNTIHNEDSNNIYHTPAQMRDSHTVRLHKSLVCFAFKMQNA